MVNLKGTIGEKISQTVTITPETEDAFNIVKVSPFKSTDIRYTIEEIKLSGKKAYQLTVENIKETEGRYMDKITIITDKGDLPPLIIPVVGDIKPLPIENNKAENNQPASPDGPEQKP